MSELEIVMVRKYPRKKKQPDNLAPNPWLRIYSRIGKYPKVWDMGRIQKIMRSLFPECEICGESATSRMLDVHHLRYLDKHDCRLENLLVVCRSCHSSIHRHEWTPDKPWNIAKSPGIPQGLIDRKLLDKKGNPISSR